MDLDRTIAEIARRQHGVFIHAQAIGVGFTRQKVQRRVSTGRWQRVHRGVYCVAGTCLSFEGQVRAALFASGPGSVASHDAAARIWGFKGYERTTALHVTIPRHRSSRLAGVVVHRSDLPRHLATVVGGLDVTTAARTIADLASTLGVKRLEDVVDDAVRRGLLRLDLLSSCVSTVGGRGTAALRVILSERLDRSTESSLEREFQRKRRRARLPEPIVQYEVRDDAGHLIGRVDVAYPEERLLIEIDGFAFHSDRAAFERDRARQNRLIEAGYDVLRFTSDDIGKRWPATRATIQRILGSRGRT